MKRSGLRRWLQSTTLLAGGLLALAEPGHAQNATWNLNGTGNWNTDANWTPATVPTGTAMFGVSNQNPVSFSPGTTLVGTINFTAGASAFVFNLANVNLNITAGGISNLGPVQTFNNLSAATLNFSNASQAGANVTINNSNSTVNFSNTASAANAKITNTPGAGFINTSTNFSNNSTAGNASITNNAFATTNFFNTSTAGNAIIINNGTQENLSFSNSSTAGNATITNNADSATSFRDTSTAGNAIITSNGNASVSFLNNSTAAGARLTNNDNAVVDFANNSTAANAIITNSGTSSVFFDNTSTAGNATILNNGVTLFGTSSSAGSAAIVNNGGVTQFVQNATAGNATITTNANGLLDFANSSTAGNATITTNSGGKTQFRQTSSGGSARLITNAGGEVDISRLTSAGTTAGSIEGAGKYSLGSKQLTVGGNNLSTEVSGVIADGGAGGGTGGALVKVGTGILILSGNNTLTGATSINAGTLVVNGSIGNSAVTVNSGGALAGGGIVGQTTVKANGTFAPGAAGTPATMTIAGSLALQSGALYLVQVNPTSASRADASATAALGGTVQAVFAPGSYVARSYTILSAGSLSSTFDGVASTNLPAGFAASLSYTANEVHLDLTAALGTLSTASLSGNQAAVAGALNSFFNNGGLLPPAFLSVFNLSAANQANALTLLSGEAATEAQQGAFQLMSQFLGLMLDPFVYGRAGVGGAYGQASPFAPEREPLPGDIALAYAKVLRAPVYKTTPFEQRWSVWGGAYGGYNKTSGDPVVAGSHDLSARTAGVAAGIDYRIAPGTVVGFALAGAGTGWSLAQGLGGGGSDAFQAGVYGTTRSGPVYLAAALAYTRHWMSTDRYANAGDHLYASFNAQSVGVRAEAGYRIPGVLAAVTPYAALQAQNFHTPAYSEADYSGGGFGLTYNARNATDSRGQLGARFDRQILVNWNAALALRAKVAWAHDWISDPSLVPAFQALPGASFIVNGAIPAKNLALTSAGAELRLVNGLSLLGKFDGEFAAHSQTYAGTGTVRYVW